jgi:hypothetical protein
MLDLFQLEPLLYGAGAPSNAQHHLRVAALVRFHRGHVFSTEPQSLLQAPGGLCEASPLPNSANPPC